MSTTMCKDIPKRLVLEVRSKKQSETAEYLRPPVVRSQANVSFEFCLDTAW